MMNNVSVTLTNDQADDITLENLKNAIELAQEFGTVEEIADMKGALSYFMDTKQQEEYITENDDITIANLVLSYYMIGAMPELAVNGEDRTEIRNRIMSKPRHELVDFILGIR